MPCVAAAARQSPNASGSNENTTANCVASSTTVALTAAEDFANGQGISLEHCGATFTGATPTGLTVVPNTGIVSTPTNTTTYSYRIACLDAAGGVGAAIAATTITNGDATLGRIVIADRYAAFNTVSWTTSCAGVALWKSISGGAFHLVGAFGGGAGSTVDDAGLAQVTIPWIPDTPTTAPLNDRLLTSIVSGAGTVSIVTAVAPSASVTGALARHDDTAALVTYLASTPVAVIPAGTFNVEGVSPPSTSTSMVGGAGLQRALLTGRLGKRR